MARKLKLKDRKSPPQLRVRATEELLASYERTARRFGYGQVAPFVRRLLDAARLADPRDGRVCLHDGTDVLAALPPEQRVA